jgi:hypothetical protein
MSNGEESKFDKYAGLISRFADAHESWLPGVGAIYSIALDQGERAEVLRLLRAPVSAGLPLSAVDVLIDARNVIFTPEVSRDHMKAIRTIKALDDLVETLRAHPSSEHTNGLAVSASVRPDEQQHPGSASSTGDRANAGSIPAGSALSSIATPVRGAYEPLTVAEIEEIRKDGLKLDFGKLDRMCSMAINCLLYGDELRRRDASVSHELTPTLPCDLIVGAGCFKKGTRIATAQAAIDRMYERLMRKS